MNEPAHNAGREIERPLSICDQENTPLCVRSNSEQLPIAAALPRELLIQDVERLPSQCQLLTTNEFTVFQVYAEQIPHLMHEIGRLREISYRLEGEGCGRSLDLDRFDQTYVHLLLWSQHKQELAGAYRIAKADQIIARDGKQGLYTHTLFRYDDWLLQAMGPALELGRSFIRLEYQRHYSALLLLWKGIALMIAKEPHYRTLFGAVTISNEYSDLSQRLLESFLRTYHFDPVWAQGVIARNPPPRNFERAFKDDERLRNVRTVDQLSEMIADIEPDHKKVPILLKQYLKLGGRMLSFNVDNDFSDVIDGLIAVDLLGIDQRHVVRLLGSEAAERFLIHHGRKLMRKAG
ncbi:MAG TPA: GNAT family N-acyltransferase [Pirellulaceae bacterium]|nr:GNAT family N-acyltransferase [Pirellulaceae bacterium]HMO93653.1 GNAT family N-acyltransferase [Pirellulaceae bacterium]HMP70657.1 GNAT family N-acyltransferase [Pirellulaceae bacterium]